MASTSFQVHRGQNMAPEYVTVGTAAPTTAKAIELRIDKAANWTSQEVVDALDAFKRRIEGYKGPVDLAQV